MCQLLVNKEDTSELHPLLENSNFHKTFSLVYSEKKKLSRPSHGEGKHTSDKGGNCPQTSDDSLKQSGRSYLIPLSSRK